MLCAHDFLIWYLEGLALESEMEWICGVHQGNGNNEGMITAP
jgi:hypothetical protein